MKGEDVKKILKANGITQRDLAEKFGTTAQNISDRLGKDDITTGFLENISAATGIPVSAFYPASVWGSVVNSPAAQNQVTNIPESVIQLLAKKDEQIDRLLSIIEGYGK